MKNGKIILKNGDIKYYLNNKLHREDGPAVENNNGNYYWYQYGKLHRTDGPAVIEYSSRYWYVQGIILDEVESNKEFEQVKNGYLKKDGSHYYFRNFKLHRDDGPAYINRQTCHWHKNGKIHRKDGPAIIHTDGKYGYQEWFINDKRHRLDGPAVIYKSGDKEYWINDEEIECSSDKEFIKKVKMKAFW